ncbi:hypothetical protein GCM10022403_096180 [Streptomyces coacervatus]|uniref:Uncharacterized protein n=1 Tax=Streptomyces coacervatus TaxID=647381 RepID=A0ABP7JN53_9ACTN
MTAEARRHDKRDRCLDRLLPRQYGHPGPVQQFGDARPERRRPRAGDQQLHPEVVVEERQDVEQAGRGGHVVDDEEHLVAAPTGGPPCRVVADRHPYPPGPRHVLAHLSPPVRLIGQR